MGVATSTAKNLRMEKLLDTVLDSTVEQTREETNPPLKGKNQKVEDMGAARLTPRTHRMTRPTPGCRRSIWMDLENQLDIKELL